MTFRSVRAHSAFPALVIAAFVVRNALALIALSILALATMTAA